MRKHLYVYIEHPTSVTLYRTNIHYQGITMFFCIYALYFKEKYELHKQIILSFSICKVNWLNNN